LAEAVSRAKSAIVRRFRDLSNSLDIAVGKIFGLGPLEQRTYRFQIPAKFRNWTLRQWSKLSGAVLEMPGSSSSSRGSSGSFLEVSDEAAAALPENYNFFDKYRQCLTPEYLSQGSCGSCWAFSISGMLHLRTCKALIDAGKPPADMGVYDILSPQALISCATDAVSRNADGCNGGKVGDGIGLLSSGNVFIGPIKCHGYYSGQGFNAPRYCENSKKLCAAETDPRYRRKVVSGPARAMVGEAAIKAALFEQGPLTIVFKTPATFIGATGIGVFSRGDSQFLADAQPGSPHQAHAVVVTGWGVEKGVRYWTLLNSWGEIYKAPEGGSRAMIKVIRGVPGDMLIELVRQYDAVPMFLNENGERVPVK
jgi:hypothetical protein